MGPYWRDLGERVGWTFLQAGLTVVPVTVVGADWSTVKTVTVSAAVAGGTAVLSLVKGIVAQHRGNPQSASMAKDV